MSKQLGVFLSRAIFVFLLAAASLSAQVTTGDVSGTVMDQSGASVGGVVESASKRASGIIEV